MARSSNSLVEATESSPLLTTFPNYDEAHRPLSQREAWQTPKNISLLIMLAVLLFSLGDQWMDSPQTRIFEAIICYRYYEKADPSKLLMNRSTVRPGAIGGVAEMWCKIDIVQSDLAALRGWQQLFDGFPTLLLAVPLGWVADTYGRKPIIVLNLIALILRAGWIQMVTWFWQSFDIRWVWLSTLFASIGGGSSVLTSTLFVILSDITPEAKRAGMFMRAGAFNLLAALVMPPLAALLMDTSPWIPNFGGTILEILTLVLYTFCPETLEYEHPSLPRKPAPIQPEQLIAVPPIVNDLGGSHLSLAVKQVRGLVTDLAKSLSFLADDWRVPVLISPFLIHMLVGVIGQLLLQYVSKRYEIKLSQAIILTTVRTGVIVLLLFAILPYISMWAIRNFDLSAQKKDLYLARISITVFALGWILVGLSPNIPLVLVSLAITSLGYGTWLLLRSFMTSLLQREQIARVYSVLSVIDTLGVMAGSPLMAGLFKHGFSLGGFWVGLPFCFLGLAGACFLLPLLLVGLRKGEDEATVIEDGE